MPVTNKCSFHYCHSTLKVLKSLWGIGVEYMYFHGVHQRYLTSQSFRRPLGHTTATAVPTRVVIHHSSRLKRTQVGPQPLRWAWMAFSMPSTPNGAWSFRELLSLVHSWNSGGSAALYPKEIVGLDWKTKYLLSPPCRLCNCKMTAISKF